MSELPPSEPQSSSTYEPLPSEATIAQPIDAVVVGEAPYSVSTESGSSEGASTNVYEPLPSDTDLAQPIDAEVVDETTAPTSTELVAYDPNILDGEVVTDEQYQEIKSEQAAEDAEAEAVYNRNVGRVALNGDALVVLSKLVGNVPKKGFRFSKESTLSPEVRLAKDVLKNAIALAENAAEPDKVALQYIKQTLRDVRFENKRGIERAQIIDNIVHTADKLWIAKEQSGVKEPNVTIHEVRNHYAQQYDAAMRAGRTEEAKQIREEQNMLWMLSGRGASDVLNFDRLAEQKATTSTH